MTDWQKEIELRLIKSKLYSTLKLKAEEKGQAVASQQLNLIFEYLFFFAKISDIIFVHFIYSYRFRLKFNP